MRFAYLIEPPFNYIDPVGCVTGCDVELARYVFSQLGVAEIKLVQTEFAELLPGLGDGRWRMTTGLFGTDERRQSALFSRPIWALPDGLLVQTGNPLGLCGYQSVADNAHVRLAVIRDQFQHRTAIAFGVGMDRIVIYKTYTQAAQAVRDGTVDAYASVGRAHSGFIAQNPDWGLDVVMVPISEKPSAFGSFAFALKDTKLVNEVDEILSSFLGTNDHRKMVASFGFSSDEVDLVVA